MSVIHQVYFAGVDKPVELELETDDLFRKFNRWLDSDSAPRGMVVTTEQHSLAINFAQVSSIALSHEKPRKRMGF